jgi:PAS domain S-box-containing protein
MKQLDPKYQSFLVESAPDGIVVVDSSGTIVAVNTQTERLFGYGRDELLGQPIEILVPERFASTHNHDRDAYMHQAKIRPMGAGRFLSGRTKTGGEFPVEISLSPIMTDDGQMVMSIVRDITERRRAEEMIQASLREKEALLKEIHHRVKNNLQVTSSLLRLQAASIADPAAREMFEETEGRIRSMALVHEKLYQSTDLSKIDLADYVRSLAELLFRSSAMTPENVTIDVTGREIFLAIDEAVPCGLIVNELLSNALKHAFSHKRRGRIEVHLNERADGHIFMSVRDNGVGLPSDFDLNRTETLGLQLVQGLIRQIDGTIAVRPRADGAEFDVIFPGKRGTNVVGAYSDR